MRVRASVEVSSTYKPRTRLWGYGYEDLSKLFEVEEQTVRLWVSSGHLDPGNLESLLRALVVRRPELIKAKEVK